MTENRHNFLFNAQEMKDKYIFIPFVKGKEIYANFNFSVFLDDYCNAQCKFCVANIRCRSEKRKNIFGKNYGEYLKSLDKIFAFIRPYNPTISLTGGEPALYPCFKEVAALVNKYNFRIKAITTNATQLLKNNGSVIKELADNNWTYLNMSLPHWQEDIIRKVMRYKEDIPASFKDLLAEVRTFLNGTNIKPRLSCVLLKEGINCLDDCIKYINFYNKLGYDNFIFRQLTNFTEENANLDIIRYNEDNLVRCLDIWQENDRRNLFTFFKRNIGYYYYVELYKYSGCTVAFEAADLARRAQEMAKHNLNRIYEVVYHPNGNLCSGWDGGKEIILNYKDL